MSAAKSGEAPDPIKRLCKLGKDDFDTYELQIRAIVAKPKYVCRKCLRASRKKKYLCKPENL